MQSLSPWFRSILLGIFCFVFLLPVTGRTQESSLTFANYRDLRDLNPHLYGGEIFAQNLLFEGLVFLSEDGTPVPWLAKSWSVSKDGTTYTFDLRDDVTFSDGTKFNAHTVKQNFDALLDNGNRHTWLESVRLMLAVQEKGEEAVKVLDDYKVQIAFTSAYYPFIIELGVTRPFRMLASQCFQDGTTKNGIACTIGTGSYILKEHVIDQQATFVRNPSYWGEKPQIETIVAKVIPDPQARLLALQNGEIDMIYGLQLISPRAFIQFEKATGFEASMSSPVSTRMLILNGTRDELQDRRVRQALNHLTNRAIISEKIMLGLEAPAQTLLSRNTPYADIDLAPYAYDKAAAHKLLTAAGYVMQGKQLVKDGKPFKIVLSYDADKVIEKTIAQYLQSEWAKSGITLSLLSEEEQAHRDRLKEGNFDLSFNISWGTPYDPQSFLGGMRKSVYGDYAAQQGLKQKAKIDNEIMAALAATDKKERQAHYTYVLENLHKEAIYIPLTYERNRAIFADKVKAVGFNPSQFEIPLQRMRVE